MLTPGSLGQAFSVYWQDMNCCRTAGAYWSLLHVTVCLPDICAALQSENGEAKPARYISWCDKYLPDPKLLGSERYRMRCKVLHQGRASIDAPGRYDGFSFSQPTLAGQVDHLRVDGPTLIVDVGKLAEEYRAGVERWIRNLETNPGSLESCKTEEHISSLIQVRQFPIPSPAQGAPHDLFNLVARSS